MLELTSLTLSIAPLGEALHFLNPELDAADDRRNDIRATRLQSKLTVRKGGPA